MKKILIILLLLPTGLMATDLTGIPKDSTEREHKKRRLGTHHLFNLDFGINNYHKDGTFPDEENADHSVRPWGSWYFALTSLQRSHLAGGMFVEWGGGISWYNFKFQDDNTIVEEGAEGVEFYRDNINDYHYEKSKLTISHLNFYLVPVYQFGKIKKSRNDRKWNWCGYDDRGFRIGAGGYAGYRLGSHTKLKYEEADGDTEKTKNRENFFLENIRYGLRFQVGYKGTDLFLNYDLNNLFSENRGPELSAVSFGLMF